MEHRRDQPTPARHPRADDLGPGREHYVDLPPARPNLRPAEPAPIGGIVGAALASALCVVAWRVMLFLHNCQLFFGVGPAHGARTFDWGDWQLAFVGIGATLPLVAFAFMTKHPTLRFPAMALAILPVAFVLWTTNAQLANPDFWVGRCS